MYDLLRGWQKSLDNHIANLWMGKADANRAAGGLQFNLRVAAEKIEKESLSSQAALKAAAQVLADANKRSISGSVGLPICGRVGSSRGCSSGWRCLPWRR